MNTLTVDHSRSADDSYELNAVHGKYLCIMDHSHQYCLEHDIKYSFSGSSLLGVVRHHGFIPWDDADVMFTRDNYEKFLDCFKANPMSGYEIIGNSWVKRITRKDNSLKEKEELYLDLFVFDVVSAIKLSQNTRRFISRYCRECSKKSQSTKGSLYHINAFLLSV